MGNKSIWGKILHIVITMLTAIATTFGVTSCMRCDKRALSALSFRAEQSEAKNLEYIKWVLTRSFASLRMTFKRNLFYHSTTLGLSKSFV